MQSYPKFHKEIGVPNCPRWLPRARVHWGYAAARSPAHHFDPSLGAHEADPVTVTWTEFDKQQLRFSRRFNGHSRCADFDLLPIVRKVEEPVRVARCNNIGDFRSMAQRRLPRPIFHYIDVAVDDEVTYRRNTEAYERCDLVPNVLAGVESIDISITVMGQKIQMPLFCAPTALQWLFHHDGERAVAKAAQKFGTMFGISSLGTISIEEIRSTISTPNF